MQCINQIYYTGSCLIITEEELTRIQNLIDWVNYQIGVAYKRTKKEYAIQIDSHTDTTLTLKWNTKPPQGLRDFCRALSKF
jgi:hypothetical protein